MNMLLLFKGEGRGKEIGKVLGNENNIWIWRRRMELRKKLEIIDGSGNKWEFEII